MIVREHVITGVSRDDLDIPGYLESHDAKTSESSNGAGMRIRRPTRVLRRAKTWPTVEAMMHGSGRMTWVPGTYDPALNLFYTGTGNPQPVIAGQGR